MTLNLVQSSWTQLQQLIYVLQIDQPKYCKKKNLIRLLIQDFFWNLI
jgi:hypothetical protein